jgi:hypothetical protein
MVRELLYATFLGSDAVIGAGLRRRRGAQACAGDLRFFVHRHIVFGANTQIHTMTGDGKMADKHPKGTHNPSQSSTQRWDNEGGAIKGVRAKRPRDPSQKPAIVQSARLLVRDVADVAVIPLVFLIAGIFFFALTPITNTQTRTGEHEADMYGLNASRQPDGFAQAAIHLGEYRKMNPGPVEEWVFFDHPSGRNRIHDAMQWKAENLRLFQDSAPATAPAPSAEPTK